MIDCFTGRFSIKLRLLTGLLAFTLWGGWLFDRTGHLMACAQHQPSPEELPLRSIAPERLKVGGALHAYDDSLWASNEYLAIAEREFSSITGTVYMAYGGWPSERSRLKFKSFERAVDWASKRQLKFHGHAILYPAANRDLDWWMNQKDRYVESNLRQYVNGLVRCRKGKVWVWDVVNEVMADDGNPMDSNGLRTDYKEYRAIGPDYVEKVFQWTHRADKKAILILNDYGIEPLSPKSDRLLAYAKALKKKGVPIHGIGFQFHIFDTVEEPDYDSIRANFQRFAEAGFKLYITEMDVMAVRQDPLAPGVVPAPPSPAEMQRQKRIYQKIAKIAHDQPACESLLLWDYVDNYSWLHPSIIDSPSVINLGQYGFPTPFSGGRNEPIQAKPAFRGLQNGLAGFDSTELDYRNFRITSKADLERGGLLVRFRTVLLDSFEMADIDSSTWLLEPVAGMPDYFRVRCDIGGEELYLSRTAKLVEGNWEPDSGVYLDSLNEEWFSQRWKIVPEEEGTYSIQNAWDPASGILRRSIEEGQATSRLILSTIADEAGEWILNDANQSAIQQPE